MGQHVQAAATYAYICQQKNWVNHIEIVESSYKQLNSCFMAITSFYKV